MKEIFGIWKDFIKESLAKDVERHQLASELFDYIFTLAGSLKKESEYSYKYYNNSIGIITEPGENNQRIWIGNEVVVSFATFPSHLRKLFIDMELPKEGKKGEEKVALLQRGLLTINLVSYPSDKGAAGVYTMPKLDMHDEFYPQIWIFDCKFSSLKSIKKETLENLKAKKSTIIHEIAHLIDDVYLMGHKPFRHKTEKSEEERDKYFKKGYYNAGIEVNARWVEILNWLNGRQYSDYKNLDNDLAERFEYWMRYAKRLMLHHKMAPAKQRKFISRFYEFYENGPYKAPQHIIDFEVKRLVDEHMARIKEDFSYIRYADYDQFYQSLWWNENDLRAEELWGNKVIMRYFYPLGHSPYPYSPENAQIIANKAKEILTLMIEKFAAKNKDKFR